MIIGFIKDYRQQETRIFSRNKALDLIPPVDRRDEESFWQEFDKARAGILGGLLDALSKAMGVLPKLKLKNLPRMADFAHWGAAAAIALGCSNGEFAFAYKQNVNRQNEAAIESSPVAQAVIKFMERQENWDGTPSQLLQKLEHIAEHGLSININRKPWPQASNVLWRRLQEVRPNLLAAGISVERDRTGSRRFIRLQKVGGESSQPSLLSGETPDGDEKGGNDSLDDGCDGDDGSANTSRGKPKTSSKPPQKATEEDAYEAAKALFPGLLGEDSPRLGTTKEVPDGVGASDPDADSVVEAIMDNENSIIPKGKPKPPA